LFIGYGLGENRRGNKRRVRIVWHTFECQGDVFAQVKHISRLQHILSYQALAVHESAICGIKILQNKIAALVDNPGVMALDFGVCDRELIGIIPPDVCFATGQLKNFARRGAGTHG